MEGSWVEGYPPVINLGKEVIKRLIQGAVNQCREKIGERRES